MERIESSMQQSRLLITRSTSRGQELGCSACGWSLLIGNSDQVIPADLVSFAAHECCNHSSEDVPSTRNLTDLRKPVQSSSGPDASASEHRTGKN